jgi:hypothetical protein
VSRIWGLTIKHSTRTLPDHATRLSINTPLSSLRFGDVFDKPGSHVLCFNLCLDPDTFYAYESTTRNGVDRVVYWTRSKAELAAAGYSI